MRILIATRIPDRNAYPDLLLSRGGQRRPGSLAPSPCLASAHSTARQGPQRFQALQTSATRSTSSRDRGQTRRQRLLARGIVAGAKHLHLGQEDLADADVKAIRECGLDARLSPPMTTRARKPPCAPNRITSRWADLFRPLNPVWRRKAVSSSASSMVERPSVKPASRIALTSASARSSWPRCRCFCACHDRRAPVVVDDEYWPRCP